MFHFKKITQVFSLIFLLSLGMIACSKNANQSLSTSKPSFVTEDIMVYGGNDKIQDWFNAIEAFAKGVEPNTPPFVGLMTSGIAEQLGFKNTQIPNLNKPVRFFVVKKAVSNQNKVDPNQPLENAQIDQDFPEPAFLLSFHINDADSLNTNVNQTWTSIDDQMYIVKNNGQNIFVKKDKDLLIVSTHKEELLKHEGALKQFNAEKYASQTSITVNAKAFSKQIVAIQKEYQSDIRLQKELKQTPFYDQLDLLIKNLQDFQELSFVFNVKATEIQLLNAITIEKNSKLLSELSKFGKNPNEYLKLISQPVNALFFIATSNHWKDHLSQELIKMGINAVEYASVLESMDQKSLFLYASNSQEILGIDIDRSSSDKFINQSVDLINKVIDQIQREDNANAEQIKVSLVESSLQGKELDQIELKLTPELKAEISDQMIGMNILVDMLSNLSIVDQGNHSLYSFGTDGKAILEKHMQKGNITQAEGLNFLNRATAQTFFALYFDAALINNTPSKNQYLNMISMLDQNRIITEFSISRGFAKAVYDLAKGFFGMFNQPQPQLEPMDLDQLKQPDIAQ
jgi:hypothetical protein